MLTDDTDAFLAFAGCAASGPCPATARAVLLMAPRSFSRADDCAADNLYMGAAAPYDQDRAQRQLRKLAESLCDCGIPVMTFPGLKGTPDAVFPNNVFATAPGRLVIGSMCHPSRQRETQRADLPEFFNSLLGYEIIDLRRISGCVAELTGAVVIDRARGLGFHGLSARLNRSGARAIHEALGLQAGLMFELAPDEYHTNILLCVLASRAAVVYPRGIACAGLLRVLRGMYGDAVVVLSKAEKNAFAGNCIALTDKDLFISATATAALSRKTRHHLDALGFVLHSVELSEIEKAGGSLRCMVAEVF